MNNYYNVIIIYQSLCFKNRNMSSGKKIIQEETVLPRTNNLTTYVVSVIHF